MSAPDLARAVARVLVEHTSSIADAAWVSLDRLIEADRERVRAEERKACEDVLRPEYPDAVRALQRRRARGGK